MAAPLFNHSGYNQYLVEHKIMGTRCLNCGRLYLPPRVLCPNCYATQMQWYPFSGEGIVVGFSTIYVGLSTMIDLGYSRDKPYCSAVVQLAEGPLISGQIVDADCEHPQDIYVGLPVRAAWIEYEASGTHKVLLGFERQPSQ